jgi:ribosomal protein L13E
MCVETSEREQRKLEEKGEFSKQVSLDRLAMGIVYSHRYYEDNSMNSADEVDYASWTHRWADAKSYKKNPWPALTQIRNGWAYTHAQICQPLQDWADAVDARKKSTSSKCGEAKDEGMDCAGGSVYDKRKETAPCADHGDGHGNVCTSLDFADEAATCCTSLTALKAVSLTELKKDFTVDDLKKAGFTAKDLKEKGFTLDEVRKAGFTAKELYAEGEGFTVEQLKDAGFTLKELKEEGFTVAQLVDGTDPTSGKDFLLEELKNAGFTRENGFSAKDLYADGKGFTSYELRKEGFTLKELKDKGFTKAELMSGNKDGWLGQELTDAGIK